MFNVSKKLGGWYLDHNCMLKSEIIGVSWHLNINYYFSVNIHDPNVFLPGNFSSYLADPPGIDHPPFTTKEQYSLSINCDGGVDKESLTYYVLASNWPLILNVLCVFLFFFENVN